MTPLKTRYSVCFYEETFESDPIHSFSSYDRPMTFSVGDYVESLGLGDSELTNSRMYTIFSIKHQCYTLDGKENVHVLHIAITPVPR